MFRYVIKPVMVKKGEDTVIDHYRLYDTKKDYLSRAIYTSVDAAAFGCAKANQSGFCV